MPIYRSNTDSFLLSFSKPSCRLTAAPTFTVEANGRLSEYMSAEVAPQAVLMNVTEELCVSSPSGDRIGTLAEYMELIRTKAYPILRFSDKSVGEQLAAFCDANNMGDLTLCVPWELRGLLGEVRRKLPLSRGMLDLRGCELPSELLTLASECNLNEATQLLLDRPLSREQNRSLQKRFIQVWVKSDKSGLADAVCSGACGIVTDCPTEFLKLLERFPEGATVRPLPLYAHKGFHATGETPENSLIGVTEAGKRGYDAAEIDVQPSRDGVLLLQHDRTSGNIFDRNLSIVATDYEELLQLRRKSFPEVSIDRLEDVLHAMSEYPETPIMLEIKSPPDTFGVEYCVEQIGELAAHEASQKHFVIIMGVMPPYLDHVHRHLPTIPLTHCIMGLGNEAPANEREANLQISKLAFDTRGANAGVNPYHEKANDLLGRAAHLRGITLFVWTWAFKPWEVDMESICNSLCSCYDGLTSDWVHMFEDCPIDVTLDEGKTYKVGEKSCISGKALLRAGREASVDSLGIIPLDGSLTVSEDGAVTADAGEHRVIPYCTYSLPNGSVLRICGSPSVISVTIQPEL